MIDVESPALTREPVCVESVAGCEDCRREASYKASVGHKCGASDPGWSTMCEVFGDLRREDEEFHRRSHEPQLCEGCGRFLRDNFGYDAAQTRLCPARYCTIWYCPSCDHEVASAGPVGCPNCGRWFRDPRLSRIRTAYRRRRRYW